VRESRPPGSVRGAPSNGCPYRETLASEDSRRTSTRIYEGELRPSAAESSMIVIRRSSLTPPPLRTYSEPLFQTRERITAVNHCDNSFRSVGPRL